MTSAYHSVADHFLALEGHAATAAPGQHSPTLSPPWVHTLSPAGQALSPGLRCASFTKGQTQAEALRGPGKGRSFPALPKHHTSAAPPVQCLVQRRLPRLLPLHSRAPGVSSNCHTLQMGCPAQHRSLWQTDAVLKKARKPPFLLAGPSPQFLSLVVLLLLLSLHQILNSHLSTSRRPYSLARRRTLGYHASCPSQILTSH